jgi:hypothetical protein
VHHELSDIRIIFDHENLFFAYHTALDRAKLSVAHLAPVAYEVCNLYAIRHVRKSNLKLLNCSK